MRVASPGSPRVPRGDLVGHPWRKGSGGMQSRALDPVEPLYDLQKLAMNPEWVWNRPQ